MNFFSDLISGMKIDRNDEPKQPPPTRSQYVRQTMDKNNSSYLEREKNSDQIRPRNPRRLPSDIQASKS